MGEKLITQMAKGRPVVLEEVTVKLTAAQVLTLNATPVRLVKANPYDIIVPVAVAVYKPAGTAYAGIAAGEDLSIEDSGAGNLLTVETTGFLDQATEQYRITSAFALTNKATGKGLHLNVKMLAGEITTGNSPLTITVAFYRVELGKPVSIGN